MKKKMKKWFSCIMAAAMVMSTVNLPINILASDFDDGVEISVEDENEDAPEVVDSEEALNEKDGDSSESDNRESFEENEKVEENAENNTFSEFTDGTDFSDGEDLDISDSRAVGNNEDLLQEQLHQEKVNIIIQTILFKKMDMECGIKMVTSREIVLHMRGEELMKY